jgi:diphthamide synthase (EF-2-diphthine--ammonia ligase)
MVKKQKTYFNWSTGKDASLAYYHLLKDERFQIDKLVTSINAHHDRVSMHGLRRELLEKQAQVIGLPLATIELPEEPTMEVYNLEMETTLTKLKSEGYTHTGFGDIFFGRLTSLQRKPIKSIWNSLFFSSMEERYKRSN